MEIHSIPEKARLPRRAFFIYSRQLYLNSQRNLIPNAKKFSSTTCPCTGIFLKGYITFIWKGVFSSVV